MTKVGAERNRLDEAAEAMTQRPVPLRARAAAHHLEASPSLQMVVSRVPIKAAQQRLGHSRPDILLKHYTHVLDESAEFAATTLSSKLGGKTHKKTDSETDIPAIGSQTAATKKRWVM